MYELWCFWRELWRRRKDGGGRRRKKGFFVQKMAKVAKIGDGTNHVCSARGCDMDKCMCGVYHAQLFKDKGFTSINVGVANTNDPKSMDAGVFKRQMAVMASPGGAFYGANFVDMDALVPQVLSAICK